MGFTGLVSSINDRVRWSAERIMCVCELFQLVNVCRGNGLWAEVGYMGTSGNRDCQLAYGSVLKDFIDDALTISAGGLL